MNCQTLVAHKEGCADTRKRIYKGLGADQGGWTIDAETVQDIITDVYDPECFQYNPEDVDEYEQYRSDVHIFPCVELPEV